MHAPSPMALLLIAIVVLVLFGRGKVSSLMGEVGKGITSFKLFMAYPGVFYSDEIRPVPLLVALGCLVALWLVGRSRQWSAAPYVGIVIVQWLATLSSGIHASLTGMIAGLLIPAYPTQRHEVVAARQLFRDFWQSPSAASASPTASTSSAASRPRWSASGSRSRMARRA